MRDVFPEATIVRPSDVYGFEDRFLRYYASLRVFPFGIVPVLSRGNDTIKRPVYVSWVQRKTDMWDLTECLDSKTEFPPELQKRGEY